MAHVFDESVKGIVKVDFSPAVLFEPEDMTISSVIISNFC